MYKSFEEIEKDILYRGIKKKIVLCGAHDEAALKALVHARRKGVAEGILIGDELQIKELLKKLDEPEELYVIEHMTKEFGSAKKATKYVKEGIADIQMKGYMQSSTYLMPIKMPVTGLIPENGMLSETTAFYYPEHEGIMFVTDCAMNIAPCLEEKRKLIQNAVELAKAFGYEKVKVAVISALEAVNEEMLSTVHAEKLKQMEWEEDVVVDGPFALDNALNVEAAEHKKIEGQVAGRADVLLMPDMCAGNVFHKSLHFVGHLPSASVVCGTNAPVVFTSRTDSAETKYYSILSAILQAIHLNKS